MKRKIKLTLGLLLLLIVGYYGSKIFIARSETPQLVAHALASDRMKLELEDFGDKKLDALLQIQDPNFYNHGGVDFKTPGTGLTTLSQGLVKMYYFDNFKPGIQKVEQTLIAQFAFDPLISKETILKLFINEVYLGQKDGQPLKGFANAASHYYNKSFDQLTWDEYLSILAMVRAPFMFHCINKPDKNQERVNRMKKVLSGEYIPVDNSDLYYDRYTPS